MAIRTVKPVDRCFVETFNRAFRDECLNVVWFDILAHARDMIEAWRIKYNWSRPCILEGRRFFLRSVTC